MRPDAVSDDAVAAVERARHNPDNRNADLDGRLSTCEMNAGVLENLQDWAMVRVIDPASLSNPA